MILINRIPKPCPKEFSKSKKKADKVSRPKEVRISSWYLLLLACCLPVVAAIPVMGF